MQDSVTGAVHIQKYSGGSSTTPAGLPQDAEKKHLDEKQGEVTNACLQTSPCLQVLMHL